MKTHQGNRTFFTLICLCMLLILIAGSANASPTRPEDTNFTAIDAYVTEQMNNLGIPGMALGIVQDSQIVHLQGFGRADSSGQPVTPQTPFYIGSITKSFTALAVMQLVETGQINLDAPVQTYLPWFEMADKEASTLISVRHLLNQTTGISTVDGNRIWTENQDLEETVRGLASMHLSAPVGTTFQYCNMNFIIAGLVIEKVSGQSYGDYMTQHIFQPLDMRHSYTSREPALEVGLSEGYRYLFRHIFNNSYEMPSSSLPAGGLMTSVEDMAHYVVTHLDEGQYGSDSILSPQGMAELHSPAIPAWGDEHYAMGWEVGTRDGANYIEHGGLTPSFSSHVFLRPEMNQAVILLANVQGFEQNTQVEDIVRGVIRLMDGKPAATVKLQFLYRFLYALLPLTPLLQALGIVLVWRKRQSMKTWGVLLTVFLNLTLVFLIFRMSLTQLPLQSMFVFYPELGIALTAIAMLGIGWSLICTLMFMMRSCAGKKLTTMAG